MPRDDGPRRKTKTISRGCESGLVPEDAGYQLLVKERVPRHQCPVPALSDRVGQVFQRRLQTRAMIFLGDSARDVLTRTSLEFRSGGLSVSPRAENDGGSISAG